MGFYHLFPMFSDVFDAQSVEPQSEPHPEAHGTGIPMNMDDSKSEISHLKGCIPISLAYALSNEQPMHCKMRNNFEPTQLQLFK